MTELKNISFSFGEVEMLTTRYIPKAFGIGSAVAGGNCMKVDRGKFNSRT
jgi:hypothetical protein